MERSGLCQAALDGNLEGVKYQTAHGAPLDGEDCGTYDDEAEGCITGAPYYTPLGEAARMGHLECTRVLLDAGAKVDVVDYRNETPLIHAVAQDQPDTFALLLERKANVHHVGCMGNALCYTQPGYKPHANAIAKQLLELGVSPTAPDAFGRDTIEHWSNAVGTTGKVDKKIGPKYLEAFRMVLPYAGERASAVEKMIDRLETALGKAKKAATKAAAGYAELAKATSKTWAADVRAALGPITTEEGRARIEAVCKEVLAVPSAIAHPSWPQLVLDVLDRSQTYADITKRAYGKALPVSRMGDDEGGALDVYADEHLYTFDWVLHVLAQPAAIAHPQWPSLMGAVCDAKQKSVGYYSFGDDEIAALLAIDQVKWHEQFAAVLAACKAAFPYASCFGANGEHRDFPTVGAPKLPPRPKAPPTQDAAAKKATAKAGVAKAAPTKAPPKKAPMKKAPMKKAPMKKAPMKKAPMKKAPLQKAPMKKAPAKAPVKKAAAKKPPPKKKR